MKKRDFDASGEEVTNMEELLENKTPEEHVEENKHKE